MKDLSVPMNRAYLLMLPFVLLSGLLLVVYGLIWGWKATLSGVNAFTEPKSFLLAFILGTIIHEGLHGAGWKYAAKLRWSDFTYGVQWSTLTPYAHSKKPMQKSAYVVGSLLPAIVLGFVPYLIALIIGHNWLMMFGFIFTLAAGGDFWTVYTLRHVPLNIWVQDHPENVGCLVYDLKEERGNL